jgi:type IV secretory pathway VirB9-like protein
MKPTRLLSSFAVASLCAVLLNGQSSAAKRPAESTRAAGANPLGPNPAVAPNPGAPPAESEPVARVVQYGEKDVVKLKAKLRYTTLIVLPKTEKILDFTCGDKEFWVVNGSENMAYVKPAKAGAQTNLNLITASGNIYSFVLAEVSELPDGVPDLKVYVEPKDESMVSAAGGSPRFVSAQALDDYRQQADLAREETRQVKQGTQTEIDNGIHRFLSNVRFPYRFEAGRKPFFVRAIYNDDKFTYIQARPEETPVLYEIADSKPNLVNFEYADGVYVVHKILDRGYLAIGKEKLNFMREE